jgi:hypothetical protein
LADGTAVTGCCEGSFGHEPVLPILLHHPCCIDLDWYETVSSGSREKGSGVNSRFWTKKHFDQKGQRKLNRRISVLKTFPDLLVGYVTLTFFHRISFGR